MCPSYGMAGQYVERWGQPPCSPPQGVLCALGSATKSKSKSKIQILPPVPPPPSPSLMLFLCCRKAIDQEEPLMGAWFVLQPMGNVSVGRPAGMCRAAALNKARLDPASAQGSYCLMATWIGAHGCGADGPS